SREAQWIANRGYICLNVNFRGSTGYGKDFLNKGNKQWGRDMHNDLIDAINWAISSGIADKDRICIMGMSYGGYATLAGVTLTPDIFKCAIDRVGPSNLINLMNSLPDHWRLLKDNYFLRVGHPIEDKELLMEISPIFHLDKIKVPILIAHGLNDPRVNVSESENVVKHLKESNKVYEYILFEDEGHLINKEKNNYIFYKAAENFLNKYL
ncbi:MAG TPA: S9 family peptidase, partial [Clostridiaceae bacterium]|nr:S9 family peptidase [Clostridiaceae bacterium]